MRQPPLAYGIQQSPQHEDANYIRKVAEGCSMYHKPVSVGLPSLKLDTEVVMNSSRSALTTMITALFDGV